jgi:hypothetical protein
MPKTYFKIYPERQLVSIHWEGVPTAQGWYDIIERIIGHPDYRRGMNLLSYRAGSHPGMTPEFPHEFLRVFAGRSSRMTPVSVAIVTPDPCGYGMARMAEMLSETAAVVVRAFKRPREALQWLKAPVPYEHGVPALARFVASSDRAPAGTATLSYA